MNKELKLINPKRFLVLSNEILYNLDREEIVNVEDIVSLAKRRALVSWIGNYYNMIDGWTDVEIEIMNDTFEHFVTLNTADRYGIINNGWYLLLKCCNLCIENILCNNH